ncbi:MAG: hypothetical protein NXI22_17265 [bacterium]|nr:hypothetical protein [bacterium]
MRIALLLPIAFVFVGVLSIQTGAAEEPELKENIEVFMRVKLAHSQKVLEGLATEDYDQIAKHAQDMSLISQAAQWQVIQTPEYARRSAEFRREVDALMTAAKKKNLDGATLAYLKVTMNCIECHKYVRGVREASFEDAISFHAPRFTLPEKP